MSSVLDVFYFLFKSDSSEVKTGAQDAEKTVKSLNETLSASGQISEKVGHHFKDLIRQAGSALLAFASVGAVIGGIKGASHFADEISLLSKSVNVNIEDLSAWGDAVEASGGTSAGFQATVQSMTAALSDFATKGNSRAAPFFKELGIRMTDAKGKARNFIDLLPEIATKFEKLSKAESLGIGQKMGLDIGTILLLQSGRREVDAMIAQQKELGVVTKQDGDISEKFNLQLVNTEHAFRSLFITGNSTILPIFTDILKSVEKFVLFLRRHKDIVVGAFIAIGVAAAAAALTFAPFILIGIAIAAVGAAFALLYDDIRGFYKGSESVIGEMIKRWPIVGKILHIIEETIKNIVKNFWTTVGVVNAVFDALLQGGQIVNNIFQGVVSIIKSALLEVMNAINIITNAYNKVKSVLGFGGNTNVNIKAGQDALSVASNNPLGSQTSNSINSNSRINHRATNVSVGDVTIQTKATDAQGISRSFSENLDTQMRQAVNNFDDGVMA